MSKHAKQDLSEQELLLRQEEHEKAKQDGQRTLERVRAANTKKPTMTLASRVQSKDNANPPSPKAPSMTAKPEEVSSRNFAYPASWLERQNSTKVSHHCADLLYPCSICGEIPGVIQRGAWYKRRPCKCERQAYEQADIARYQEYKLQACLEDASKGRASATYTWLGYDYSPLAQRSLRNFEVPLQQEAYAMTMKYLKRVVDKAALPNVLFYGKPGLGKTHLGAALLNSCAERGYSCLFFLPKDYFDALYAADFEQKLRIRQRAGKADFLLIDDVDKALVKDPEGSAHQKGEFFQLLNLRYEAERPTFFTANSVQLRRWFDEWTVSRVQEALIKIPLEGQDYREIRTRRRQAEQEEDL